jgi:hypothetical protein
VRGYGRAGSRVPALQAPGQRISGRVYRLIHFRTATPAPARRKSDTRPERRARPFEAMPGKEKGGSHPMAILIGLGLGLILGILLILAYPTGV